MVESFDLVMQSRLSGCSVTGQELRALFGYQEPVAATGVLDADVRNRRLRVPLQSRVVALKL